MQNRDSKTEERLLQDVVWGYLVLLGNVLQQCRLGKN